MEPFVAPVRWWLRAYTSGLPAASRDRRRAEIESDLWEQVADLQAAGVDAVGSTLALWRRWLMGTPHDLLWRMEERSTVEGRPGESTGRSTMNGDLSLRSVAVPVALAAVVIVVAAVNVVIGNIQHYDPSVRILDEPTLNAVGLSLLAGGLADVVAGFAIMARRPALGAVLVVGGSWAAGITMYWLIVPILLAIGISIVGLRRASRLARAGAQHD